MGDDVASVEIGGLKPTPWAMTSRVSKSVGWSPPYGWWRRECRNRWA